MKARKEESKQLFPIVEEGRKGVIYYVLNSTALLLVGHRKGRVGVHATRLIAAETSKQAKIIERRTKTINEVL